MRDRYLYKAKRTDNGEWVEGYYLSIGYKTYIICEAETECMDGENTDLYATEWYEVDPSTLCQCTGLRDKNGKLIWENDIVKFEDTGEEGYEYKEGFDYINRAKVVWNKGRFELDSFLSNNSGAKVFADKGYCAICGQAIDWRLE